MMMRLAAAWTRSTTQVVAHLNLPCESIHLDSTSFHYDGQEKLNDDDFNPIEITKGYSRDHRPELNQVILNLICENQAGIPVYMKPASGNSNDMDGFKKIVKSHIESLKAAQASRYLIGDAALYVRSRDAWLSMLMRASLNWIACWLARGLPNCSRSMLY